eukprot:TRINITY_DN11801_c0_g1_i4.p1 TRINITY_DN11801_c0_g1~~TRINITY_DN11801_c0_g1_i4.p1  ORF type:complete len:966 (+),score=264.49 TRINITY_DN11801_c0_g1_i4:2332-5229(+)
MLQKEVAASSCDNVSETPPGEAQRQEVAKTGDADLPPENVRSGAASAAADVCPANAAESKDRTTDPPPTSQEDDAGGCVKSPEEYTRCWDAWMEGFKAPLRELPEEQSPAGPLGDSASAVAARHVIASAGCDSWFHRGDNGEWEEVLRFWPPPDDIRIRAPRLRRDAKADPSRLRDLVLRSQRHEEMVKALLVAQHGNTASFSSSAYPCPRAERDWCFWTSEGRQLLVEVASLMPPVEASSSSSSQPAKPVVRRSPPENERWRLFKPPLRSNMALVFKAMQLRRLERALRKGDKAAVHGLLEKLQGAGRLDAQEAEVDSLAAAAAAAQSLSDDTAAIVAATLQQAALMQSLQISAAGLESLAAGPEASQHLEAAAAGLLASLFASSFGAGLGHSVAAPIAAPTAGPQNSGGQPGSLGLQTIQAPPPRPPPPPPMRTKGSSPPSLEALGLQTIRVRSELQGAPAPEEDEASAGGKKETPERIPWKAPPPPGPPDPGPIPRSKAAAPKANAKAPAAAAGDSPEASRADEDKEGESGKAAVGLSGEADGRGGAEEQPAASSKKKASAAVPAVAGDGSSSLPEQRAAAKTSNAAPAGPAAAPWATRKRRRGRETPGDAPPQRLPGSSQNPADADAGQATAALSARSSAEAPEDLGRRVLLIGNVPAPAKAKELVLFFTGAIFVATGHTLAAQWQRGANARVILAVDLLPAADGAQTETAQVVFATAAGASVALALAGIEFKGRGLAVKRPPGFEGGRERPKLKGIALRDLVATTAAVGGPGLEASADADKVQANLGSRVEVTGVPASMTQQQLYDLLLQFAGPLKAPLTFKVANPSEEAATGTGLDYVAEFVEASSAAEAARASPLLGFLQVKRLALAAKQPPPAQPAPPPPSSSSSKEKRQARAAAPAPQSVQEKRLALAAAPAPPSAVQEKGSALSIAVAAPSAQAATSEPPATKRRRLRQETALAS